MGGDIARCLSLNPSFAEAKPRPGDIDGYFECDPREPSVDS